MNKLISALAAICFAFASTAVLAADPPKPAAATAPTSKLEKPASVKAEDWAKMSDAEKQKAVDAAKKTAEAQPAPKKEKKGGC